MNHPGGVDEMKDKVKKVKVELIAKEFGDAVATPSKTSLNRNIWVTWWRALSLASLEPLNP